MKVNYMKLKFAVFFISLFLGTQISYSQEKEGESSFNSFSSDDDTKTKGDKLYKEGSYLEAIKFFNKSKKFNRTEKNIRLARCYYKLNNYEKSIQFYEGVEIEDLSNEDKVFYGKILISNGKYNEAEKLLSTVELYENKEALENYKKSCNWSTKNDRKKTDVLTESTIITRGVSFGMSFYDKGVVYSSKKERKKRKKGGEKELKDKRGYDFLDLYYGELNKKGDRITKETKFARELVGPEHEGAPSFVRDENILYFTKNKGNVLRIYSTTLRKKKWKKLKEINIKANKPTKKGDKKDCNFTHPAIHPTDKFLVFTSDMPGGRGGKDLWLINNLGNGRWGEPINLGDEINTTEDEIFPHIGNDGDLYFSSNGLIGYGGLDNFKAEYNEKDKTWSNPKNLGKPINSSKDDFAFTTNLRKNEQAVMTSNRDNRKDLIYFVEYNSNRGGCEVLPPCCISEDGLISVDEVYCAIEQFFEGNEDIGFTLEYCESLIIRFFEQ